MGIELKMPALSPTMEEGKLARWPLSACTRSAAVRTRRRAQG